MNPNLLQSFVTTCPKISFFNHDSDDEASVSYLIVDIGGGTVDISTHCLVRNPEPHINVIYPPTGNDCGGKKINDAFKKFLEDLVKDNGFSCFTSTGDPAENSGNQVELNKLLNEMFEAQKVLFGENYVRGYKGGIELPSAFFKEYEHDIRQSIIEKTESVLKLVDQDLRLSHKVMSGIFESVVKGIIERIHQTKGKGK